MTLPEAFISDIRPYLPAAELDQFIEALAATEPSVSIRLNMSKANVVSADTDTLLHALSPDAECTSVPWCEDGRYLTARPQFTLQPPLHSGAYYVQEASSMFITHVLRTFIDRPVTALDLCAAPGGKSTAALSVLPEGSVLCSNEIDRRRARILTENIQKWGNPNVVVTANAPCDFQRMSNHFDLIIADVPCSGEGMFRKDPGAIAEWSTAKVHECAALQRQILRDIWPTLKQGGLLVYSTCTFNVHEDEEQLQFICDELGAEILTIPIKPEWNIHPALTGSFAPSVKAASACRFMPHFTKGEGLFMAALRKTSNSVDTQGKRQQKPLQTPKELVSLEKWTTEPSAIVVGERDNVIRAIPDTLLPLYHAISQNQKLYVLHAGVELATQKGRDFIPSHALALSNSINRQTFPEVELSLDEALNFLRRESVVLPPDTPRGYVLLTYLRYPLGFVKNIGNRCNSLFPTEWRIRNL